MIKLISKLANRCAVLIQSIQFKSVVALLLAGLVFLTTGVKANAANNTLPNRLDNSLEQTGNERPKTTGEWKAEARETEGAPLERAKRIGKETADAVGDWAEIYPDVAERTIPALQDDEAQIR